MSRFHSIPEKAAIMLLFFIFSCSPPARKQNAGEEKNISTPVFNSDTAYSLIRKQLAFSYRVPNTAAHDSCGLFLAGMLETYSGNHVIVQKAEVTAFDGTRLRMQNIIAEFNPANKSRILLCAHWDTRPFADSDTFATDKPIPGASDGASGVAVLLEIARLMQTIPPPIGVDIILFDAEDYGNPENSSYARRNETYCLGSQYWAKNLHRPGYYARFGILLDMVGAKNARFVQDNISVQYAYPIVEKVWAVASRIGYSDYFIYQQTNFLGADDHLYVNKDAKIPCIDIIQFDPGTRSGFPPYHHTHGDDISIIDKNTLRAVGQTVLEVVYSER